MRAARLWAALPRSGRAFRTRSSLALRISPHAQRAGTCQSYATVRQSYEIRMGRRTVCLRDANTPQEAVVDYVRSFGSRDDEISRVAYDRVAWRGAVFQAVLAATESTGPDAADGT